MIKFIIEDAESSPFVKMFNSAYPEDVLYCSSSNTLLVDDARRLAADGSHVIVYMDLVPDNPELYTTYRRLLLLYAKEKLDVVVIPIVCSEYLFIKSIVDVDGTIYSNNGLDVILSKSVDYKSSNLALAHSKKRSSNFEKFCKLFCDVCLNKLCCSVSSNKSGLSKPYFSGDCHCDSCTTRLSMFDKSELLHRQFPLVPAYTGISGEVLSWEQVLDISYILVDEYNVWALKFNPDSIALSKRYEVK